MNYIDLGGHSGCKIFLMESNDSHFVRKISSGLDYNERLKAQCEKQSKFSSETIKAPKVLNSGYTKDNLFYFDMEYIQGVTLSEYIKTIEIGKIRNLVNLLVDGFIDINNDNKQTADISIFIDKFNDLKSKLKGKNETVIDSALELLCVHDWSCFAPSVCHGDLTLENIIIKDDDIYLIDFLDSFYDSWILDIGTLLQDVQALWSYRFQQNLSMNTVIRLMVFKDLLLEKVENKKTGYSVEVYYALLQKLIRIFPYTKDDHTYNFLLEKTKNVIEIINKQEADICEH